MLLPESGKGSTLFYTQITSTRASLSQALKSQFSVCECKCVCMCMCMSKVLHIFLLCSATHTFFFAKTGTSSLSCLSCIIWGKTPTLPSTQIRTILTWLFSPQNHPHQANATQHSEPSSPGQRYPALRSEPPSPGQRYQHSDQNHPHLANAAQHVLILPPLLAAPAQTERAALGTSDPALKLQLRFCSRAGCVRV